MSEIILVTWRILVYLVKTDAVQNINYLQHFFPFTSYINVMRGSGLPALMAFAGNFVVNAVVFLFQKVNSYLDGLEYHFFIFQ